MKVEYLIVFKTENNICNSVSTFKNLLSTDDLLKLDDNSIHFSGKTFNFDIGHGEIADKSQKFYQLDFIFEDGEDNLSELQELLKRIRTLVKRFEGEVNVLWDDIGIGYAVKAYPVLCNLENLLRQLIAKFMITNVGSIWVNETLPSGFREAVGKSKKDSTNLLHNVDFIHLADFLFKAYQTRTTTELHEKIKTAALSDVFEIDDLKTFLPRSNWQRYFSSVVQCQDEFLNKRWSRLYELRCLVAHNNFLSKVEYEEIERLSSEVRGPLNEALVKLDQIIIPREEKEQVVEIVAKGFNEEISAYLEKWNAVSSEIYQAYERLIGEANNVNVSLAVQRLIKRGFLNEQFLADLTPFGEFKNLVISDTTNLNIDQHQVITYTKALEDFWVKWIMLEEPFL